MIFSSPCCFLLLLSPTQARVCGVLPLICSINCCTEVKVDGSTPKRWRIIRRYDKRIHDYHNYIYQIKFVHLCIQYFRRYLKIFKTTCLAITVFLIFRLKNIDLGWNYNLVSISHSIHYIYFPGGITFVGCSPDFSDTTKKMATGLIGVAQRWREWLGGGFTCFYVHHLIGEMSEYD